MEICLVPVSYTHLTKNMRKFDTRTQYFRYEVLREVARMAWDGTLLEGILDIPMKIIPGKKPDVYKRQVPDSDQLIAYNRTIEEIRQIIGADSLGYLKLERLPELTGGRQFCRCV